jgi:PAS domain S-box-containing protein
MDLMHTLGYAGMPAFITPNSANKSTQYWIAVRFFAAAAFLASAFIYPESPFRWLSKRLLLTIATAIPLAVFTGVTFLPGQMPATFIEGVGLTLFKMISEWVIISILILAFLAYWRRMAKTGERLLGYYMSAFILCIYSELSFAVYSSVFDTFNVLGHIYKVAAFCLIYRGTFVTSVSYPFQRLSELNEKLQLEIDEREKTDAELQRSRDLIFKSKDEWERTFDAITDPIMVLGVDYNIIKVNRAMAARLGKAPAEAIGLRCYEAVHGSEEPPPFCPHTMFLADKSSHTVEFHEERLGGDFQVTVSPLLSAGGELKGSVHYAREITSVKVAQKALHEEQKRFRELLDRLPAYLVLLDPDYRVPFANRFFEERFGVSDGRHCYEYLFNRTEPCESCETYTVLKTNTPHRWEWRGPDGRIYDIHDFPITGVDGSPLIMEVGLDITERKQAEEELRRAVTYNRSLIEASLDPLVTIGSDGRITDVNTATEQVTGSPRGELIGADFSDCFTNPGSARAGYRQVFSEGLVRDYPLEILHTDGHTTPVLYNATLYRDESGNVIGIFAAARDVTERKKAEAMIERQVYIQNAVNRVFHEAYTCDTLGLLGGKCLQIAEGLTMSRFGLIMEINQSGRMDAIAMSNPGWSECRIEESTAVRTLKDMEIRGIWGEVIKTGKSVVVNNSASRPDRISPPAGHPSITSFLGVPLEQGGRVIGLIGLANKENGYDDADRECMESLATAFVEAMMRKKAEVEIKRLNEDLEERVAERTTQLKAANRELEAFAYSVSHDLRAPLRTIDGFSQALLEDCRERLDDTGKDHLRRVREASQRMGTLIDDILSLSRISREELIRVPVDLSRLGRGVVEGLRRREPERNVNFVIDDGLETSGDPRLLNVVLENLLENAWKFTGRLPLARIEFSSEERDGRQVFLVRDNGAGFDMAYAGKLFTPFQRLHSQDKFPGSGIGLSLVQRIIHRHGGMVWAEGEEERGATFYFTIAA